MNPPQNDLDRFDVAQAPSFGVKRLLLFALLFIDLSLAGIYAVYAQVAGRALQWDARLLSPSLLFASLGLLLVYFAADGLRLWFTLRALGHSIPLAAIVRLVFLNIFVSNITPLATGGGVAQVWFMRRRGVPVGIGLTATTIRTALAVLFIFGSMPVLLFILPDNGNMTPSTSLIATLSVSVALYLGFFSVLLLRANWLLRPLLVLLAGLRGLHLINARRHYRWRHRLVRELQRFAHGFVRYFQGRWWDIAASLVFTAVFLLALLSFPVLLFWALGYGFDFWVVIGRMVITTFVMYFSPTPGASGIAEGLFGHFFRDVVTASHLVLVTVAWRVLTIYLGMLIGLFVTQHELASGQRGGDG
jgi:hypothetical protein